VRFEQSVQSCRAVCDFADCYKSADIALVGNFQLVVRRTDSCLLS